MLTGVGSVLNAAKVAPGSTVVVIGCGGTGPVMARQFVEQGAKVLMVARHGEDGFFVGRLSASRIQLARQSDDGWQIAHRQNYMLDGSPQGPAMLARLNEGPAV